jgi:hypothetical protein
VSSEQFDLQSLFFLTHSFQLLRSHRHIAGGRIDRSPSCRTSFLSESLPLASALKRSPRFRHEFKQPGWRLSFTAGL